MLSSVHFLQSVIFAAFSQKHLENLHLHTGTCRLTSEHLSKISVSSLNSFCQIWQQVLLKAKRVYFCQIMPIYVNKNTIQWILYCFYWLTNAKKCSFSSSIRSGIWQSSEKWPRPLSDFSWDTRGSLRKWSVFILGGFLSDFRGLTRCCRIKD